MSLLNRVLRELNRRQATQAASRPLPSGVQPTKQIRNRGRWRPALLLLTVAAIVGGGWWIVQSGADRADRAPEPASSPPGAFTHAPAPALPSAAENAAPGGTSSVQPLPGESLPRASTTAPIDSAAPQAVPSPGARDAARAPPQLAEAPDLQGAAPEEPPSDAGAPPTDAEAAFRRGLAAYRRQKTDEAEQAWRAALELDPGHDLARRALASLLVSRGDRDGAERMLADGLRSHPDQPRVALALAQLQVSRGGWRDALKTLEAGLPYAQGNAAYLAATAELKARAGQYAEAAQLFEAALHIAPDNGEWTIALGLALQADGRTGDAYEVLRRARALPSLDAQQRELIERKLRQLGG